VGAAVGFTSVEVGNALRAIFGKGPPKIHWAVGDWCAIDPDNDVLKEKGGMEVHLGFFLDEGLKVNHVKVYNLVLARPQEVLEKFVHPLQDAQREALQSTFGKFKQEFLEKLDEPLMIKAAGPNIDPGSKLLVRGKALTQVPVTVIKVTAKGIHVDEDGKEVIYQLKDLSNADVENNITHVYGSPSGFVPDGKVGRHVGQYIWCKARPDMAKEPWNATEELSIIRQIFNDDIQIVYCFDGYVGTKTIAEPWGALSDDEVDTVQTRDFQLFANAVVARDGEFFKLVPGLQDRDKALFCLGQASDEAYHKQLHDYFEAPEKVTIEPEVVGPTANTANAQRKDLEESFKERGIDGKVIWGKDMDPADLQFAKADNNNMYVIIGLAALAVFLLR